MRVGIFTDNDFEKVNGVTTALRAVLAHAPHDISVRVYTCASKAVDADDYLALRTPGIGIPYYPEMMLHWAPVTQLLRRAVADRLDLIHLTTPGPVGLAALYIARRLSLPMIGSFHTQLGEYATALSGSAFLGRVMREYVRWTYRHCRSILVPSEATRASLLEGGVDGRRVTVWGRGVSTRCFDPARRSHDLRRRWGLSDRRPGVLYAGRLSREKGLGDLAVVREMLVSARLSHRFIFVGDGPMRTELESMFPDAIFTGTLSPDGVAVAMASADVFIFPSRTDTAGNVVLEAQASGLPVLVSDCGGPQEYIRPGETGAVCSSSRDMYEHALRLCRQPALRACMGHAARQHALTRSWTAALEPLFDAYRRAIVEDRPRGSRPRGVAA